jgi:hypothetical protein
MHLEMRILAEAVKWDESTARAMRLEGFALFSTTVTTPLPAGDNDGGKLLLRSPSA